MLQVEKKERFWEEEGFGEKDVFGIGSRTFVLLEKKKKNKNYLLPADDKFICLFGRLAYYC